MGNYSLAKYKAGGVGLDEILERYPKLSRKRLERAAELFDLHGTIILLLTGIPGLDTVVALAAGASDVKKGTFIIWVSIAKIVRFWLLALIITGALGLLG
jgi:membrane protein YqaA with SNARE-associated domain